MAASGYTPIQLYYSTTASAIPTAGNLANGELAINITDGKIYYKNNSGVVTLFGSTGDVSTISFGTTGLTPSTATGGAVTVAGTLITSNGGTGLSSFTAGDLPYYASGTALSKLAIGTNGYILKSNGTAPTWVAASSVVGGAAGSNTQIQYNNSGALGASSSFVFDGTNVGIGTSSPAGKLDVNGTIQVGYTASGQSIIAFNGDTTNYQRILLTTSGTDGVLQATRSSGTVPNMLFKIDSTEKMRLDSSGNLLLGATAQYNGGKFEMAGTSSDFVSTRFVNAAGGSNIYLQHSRGASVGTNTILQAGDPIGTILFAGADGTGYSNAAYIQGSVDGTPGATADMPGRLGFFTSADGSATPTERMRIDSSGNVGIGTSSPSFKLDVSGVISNGSLKFNSNEIDGVAANTDLYIGYSNVRDMFFYTGGTGTGTLRATLDRNGNLGLGVTPSAWTYKAFQVGGGSLSANSTYQTFLSANAYYNSGWKYYDTNAAGQYFIDSNYHKWMIAASGTAGNAITFTQAMTLDASGNLGIGTTSPSGRLHINSSGAAIAYIQSTLVAGNTNVETRYISTNRTWGVGQNIIQTSSVFEIADVTASATRLAIDSSGNVGIGTSSPAKKLQSTDSNGDVLRLQRSGAFTGLWDIKIGSATTGDFTLTDAENSASPLIIEKGTGLANAIYIKSNGNVGINNTSPTTKLDVSGTSALAAFRTPNILEISTVSATAATGTINFDVTTQSVVYYTSNASGNFTLNFRGSSGTSLNTIMNTGDTVTVTFLCTNGGTAYYNSAVTVDGSSVTPKWLGGTAPTSGNASSVDAYTYAIIKTGNAAFTVLASQTKFA